MDLEFPFTLKEVTLGGLLPAVVCVAATSMALRSGCRDALATLVTNVVLAGSVLLSARLVSLPAWWPTSHWHWVPWCGVFAALVSPFWFRGAVGRRAPGLPILCVSLGTAWLIVPEWDDLPASVWTLRAIVATAIGVTSALVTPLLRRIDPRVLMTSLAATALCCSTILTCAGSLRLALVGMCVAAAFTGVSAAHWICGRSNVRIDVSALYAVLIVGALAVRRLNSETSLPLGCFVAPLMTPVVMWLCGIFRVQSASSATQSLWQVTVATIPAVSAAIRAVVQTVTSDSGGY